MLDHGIEGHAGARPIVGQRDAFAHLGRQALAQRSGLRRPDGMAAQRQYGGQLGQAVGVGRCADARHQAQHRLTRLHLVEVGLAGGAGQGDPAGGRALGGGLVADGGQLSQALAASPGAQGGQRGCGSVTRRKHGRQHGRRHGGRAAQGQLGERAAARQRQARGLHRPLGQQAQQVQRPARLGPGARQALATKGLHPHHRADDVAVDVDIAGLGGRHHLGHGLVDAGVHTLGQAVAGAVDLLQGLCQLLAGIAQHMQHRAEDLALQVADLVDLDQGRCDKVAPAGIGRQRPAPDAAPFGLQRRHMALNSGLGLGIDHRADVGSQRARVTHPQLLQRALQQPDQPVGHLVLHAQQAQRRAALAGAVEGRRHDVGGGLLGQRRAVDDHRVLAAGLGDQRYHLASGRQAPGQRGLDQARHLGGPGEQHAVDALVAHQRRAHGLAAAGQQLQRCAWHTGGMQRLHRSGGDQRGLLGRLGEHHVAGGQRCGHLPGEDRQREVPWADAQHRAERAVAAVVEIAPHFGGVVAQEVHRLAHLGHRIGAGLAGLAQQQWQQALGVGLQPISGGFQQRGACRWRGGGPGRRGLAGGPQRRLHLGRASL